MSREKTPVDEKIFSHALIALQDRLGETQEGMARRIGCTLGAYVKWRRGERQPSAKWLIKIVNVCPDLQSLQDFGFNIPPTTRTDSYPTRPEETLSSKEHIARGKEKLMREKGKKDREFAELIRKLQEINAGVQEGNRYAMEQLRAISQYISHGAGIATEPGLSRNRRAEIMKEAIRKAGSLEE